MTQALLKPETRYLLISSKPLLYIQKNAFDLYKEKKYSKEIQASWAKQFTFYREQATPPNF